MPIQYGQYNLTNSRQVRPFAGSVLPELTSVAGTLQERYDKALEQEDTLSRAINQSQAAPFSQDQQLLSQLKQEFKTKISERAKRGDYENMYRDTMLDARNFVDRYQPIAENAKKLEEYKTSLNDLVAKGTIKDPEKARKLLSLSQQTYQGLTYDPVTGQYANKFQGITPVKDIDPTEKVDKWMKDVAPTVLGSEVKYTDGVWMRYREGKWTTLKPDEIQRVITAGRRLDPEFNAWMDQEIQLSTTDVRNLTTQDIQEMKDGPVKRQLTDLMSSGLSAAQAAKKLVANDRERGIYTNMQSYANKYIRDDRQTGSGITGADPYNLERFKKKVEDEALVLSMPIMQPEARTVINGATEMLDKVRQAGTAVQAARENFDNWVAQNQLRPDGKGNWTDADGNDKTLKYLEQKQVYQQAQKVFQNLQALDTEANRRSGYNPKNISATMMENANEVARAYVRNHQRGAGSVASGGGPSDVEIAQGAQEAKAEYLRTHIPGYKQKDQFIKDMTAQGSQLVNVQTFNSNGANKQAENLFKSLVLNLDASGLNAGTQGLVWASGENAGKPLESGDYKKVAADAVFAGYAMDTDGQLKYYYKVGSVKQNAKGDLVGGESLVKMPALPGTTEILLKNKQTDLAQLGLGQQLNQTINTPSGQGYIDVDGKNRIFVDRIDKSEIGTSEVAGGLNLRFPAPGGKYTEVRVGSIGEAINMITRVLQSNAQKQNK